MKNKSPVQALITRSASIPGGIVEQFYEPSTPKDVSAIVAEAGATGTGLLIAGGRTRLHWANWAKNISRGLSLGGLLGVDEFEPDEGVLHALAGTPICEIQSIARAEGWELGLDPPGATSTVGGTIASAAVGPRAQVLGRVADAVLGLDLVGADGVASKCGGRVVKNVTGYDLAKLYCGSFGSLGLITGAWLRLRPTPAIRQVFRAKPATGRSEFEACRMIRERTSLRALVWNQAPGDDEAELVIELAGSEEGVSHDRAQIAQSLEIAEESADRIDDLRDLRAETGTDAVVLRARVLGTECEELAAMVMAMGLRVSVDLGLGTIHARGELEDPSQLSAIRESATELGGLATFEVIPDEWRASLDVFGAAGESDRLMSNLKARFDPAGILNPGRFVMGI